MGYMFPLLTEGFSLEDLFKGQTATVDMFFFMTVITDSNIIYKILHVKLYILRWMGTTCCETFTHV